jgi:hypothetical protein
MSAIDAASVAMLEAGMADPEDPIYLSTLGLDGRMFAADVAHDADSARVVRSVLMKPEHELAVDWLHQRLRALAATA